MNRLFLALRIVTLFGVIGTLAVAGTIVSPGSDTSTEGDTNNGFPFNLANFSLSSMRYQQVYASSEFGSLGGPVMITAIDFRPDGTTGAAFSSTLPSIQIDLSTTSATPATLSSTFASNVGGNDLVVFGPGALSLSSAFTGPAGGPKAFDIVINLTTPFLYNPAGGSLLLDVRNFGGGGTTQFDAATSPAVQRVFATTVSATTGNLGGSGGGTGLVTQFVFSATTTPEPSTFSMLGLIAAGVMASRFRRKRQRGI